LTALLGAVAFCGLFLAVFAYGDCRHADELTASGVGLGTPRTSFCGALPLGGMWWFVPGFVPLALTALICAVTRRRAVPSATGAAATVLAAAIFVVVLHSQSTSGVASP
jgi:hypothetical protein